MTVCTGNFLLDVSGDPESATKIIVMIHTFFMYILIYVSLCNAMETGGRSGVHKTFRRRSKTTSGRLVCFHLTSSVQGCKILKKYLIASAIQTLIMNLWKHRRWRSFAKIVNSFHPLTIFAKSSILNVWLGSEYASALYIHTYFFVVCRFQWNARCIILCMGVLLVDQHVIYIAVGPENGLGIAFKRCWREYVFKRTNSLRL